MHLTRSSVILIFLVCLATIGLAVFKAHAAPTAAARDDTAEPTPNVPLPEDPPGDEDPIGIAKRIYDAIRSGEYVVAFGLVLVLLVSLLRIAAKRIAWFDTTVGKWSLAFAVAVFVTVGAALAAGEAVTFALIVNGLGAGFAAAGIYEAGRDLKRQPAPGLPLKP